MFGQDRNQLRRFFQLSWQKRQQGEQLEPLEKMVSDIVAQHPEYHADIENQDTLDRDFAVEQGAPNPYLHMGMHISLAEQLSTNRPGGIRDLHQKLSQQLGDSHQAEHQMMDCLGLALWEAQRAQRPPDEQNYLDCLEKLLK